MELLTQKIKWIYNHRITELEKVEAISGDLPAQNRQPVSVLDNSYMKNIFCCVQMEFLVFLLMPSASCPFAKCCRVRLCLLFSLPSGIYTS